MGYRSSVRCGWSLEFQKLSPVVPDRTDNRYNKLFLDYLVTSDIRCPEAFFSFEKMRDRAIKLVCSGVSTAKQHGC